MNRSCRCNWDRVKIRAIWRDLCSLLKEMPRRYGKISDEVLFSQGIHCMPYKNYYVFYEIIEVRNIVIVLRIGYNRRSRREILL